MADLTLSLGEVDFADFEIPDEIAAGGGQLLQIHKYAGGKRTIDSYGADNDPIAWSGIFFDQTAEARCQQLDAMRVAGEAVALTWSSFSYLVVIRRFKFRYLRFYEIHYELELEVVDDRTQADSQDGDDPESDIQDDLDDASGLSDEIGDTGLSGLMDGVFSSANSVSSIVGAPSSFLTGFSGQIGGALFYVDGLAGAADGALGTLSGIVSGGDPVSMALSLAEAGQETETMSETFAMGNTLGRLAGEVSAITG